MPSYDPTVFSRDDMKSIYIEGRLQDELPIGDDSDFQQWLNKDLQDMVYVPELLGWVET